ncbi:phosphoadenosine phosphosulfate reductase family protein [Candidatus Nasuia deltocephalinicola]|uniref:phosphoadenosine phosphosulfate reductase domain-containing protein n=1 Tax=Candidatus Nasuia deltocephalincola TaxID=1160784 RepID=UPI00216AF775|nr:phosphoadenosine phosphosulfate reductase family protein [Candidatus Nasuia deltocephalinicola]
MKKKYFSDFNPFFLKILNLNSRIEYIFFNFKNIIFSNSLSFEDIFILYFFYLKKIYNINIFFLNTGKIFLNFINFINKIKKKYNIEIKTFFPNLFLINKYIKKYNLNSFYNNIILRKICCLIRKIEVYNKIIFNFDIIITGQRSNRVNFDNLNLNFDNSRKIIKYNLLYFWDYKDIFYFIEKFNIKINNIYNQGYSSVGCEPCTKKISSEEHIRSGRWWWESFNNSKKECGLHL